MFSHILDYLGHFWEKNRTLIEREAGTSVDKLITFINLSVIFLATTCFLVDICFCFCCLLFFLFVIFLYYLCSVSIVSRNNQKPQEQQ